MDEFSNDQQVQPIPPVSVGGGPNQAVMTVKDWLITLLILAIPCVGIIMYFVWAFGEGNENRKNYCRAALIWLAILIVIYILIWLVLGATILSMANFSY